MHSSFTSPEHQVVYRIANALVHPYPFPHIYVQDVFPADFYKQMRQHLPPRSALTSLVALGRVSSNYPETRQVLPLAPEHIGRLDEPYRTFWEDMARWLLGQRLGQAILSKFASLIQEQPRFADKQNHQFSVEAFLVQDETNYLLQPHTDSPRKVLSFLFYLPEDDSMVNLGTSIYLPNDPAFQCDGSQHWSNEKFERVATMPYLPNTLFAFLKTPRSFHGVERVEAPKVRRHLILLDFFSVAAAG
jgi:hypothetical protein